MTLTKAQRQAHSKAYNDGKADAFKRFRNPTYIGNGMWEEGPEELTLEERIEQLEMRVAQLEANQKTP